MFNRQPYNRGKFNVSSAVSTSANGIGLMVMNSNTVNSNKIISANGFANLYMKDNAEGTNVKYNLGTTGLALNSFSDATKMFIASSDMSSLVLGTEANQTLSGESVIDLEGIILRPGEELVINTIDMTVTINGQNAMEYFSNDSEFFNLLNGLNTLIYNDSNSSRNVSFDVIWKDRWL
ncbi:MAG: hypothetical protein GX053_12590 [Tissierella sp.]|nr:hypothetical protein [Tissierella sp.]